MTDGVRTVWCCRFPCHVENPSEWLGFIGKVKEPCLDLSACCFVVCARDGL
jgi:hypothetical protein